MTEEKKSQLHIGYMACNEFISHYRHYSHEYDICHLMTPEISAFFFFLHGIYLALE